MTDIYQSPGDRLRFEILLKSLTEGSINLAVMSDHDMVLDYYGSLFEERLRSKGESHIEWCSSTNSERLVQKFNEILSEITLDQALEKDKKHAPRRFLLFRDSILMQDFELQLLARLVNGFPAGNISVILLINSAGNYQSKVDAFGKNLVKWEVETEHGEAKQKLTDWVATTPDPEPVQIEPTFNADPPTLSDEVVPVSKLLNIPAKTAWRVPGFGKKDEPKPEPEVLPAFVPPLPDSTQSAAAMSAAAVAPSVPASPLAAPAVDTSREPSLQAGALPADDTELFKRQPRKSRAGWVLLVLLVSMSAFGLMYKEAVLQEVETFKKYLLRGTPAVPAPEEAASAAAAASAASAEALAAAELAASMAAEAARVASEAQEVASAASAAASVAVPVASEPVLTASAAEPVKKKTEKELKADKAQAKKEAKTEAKAEPSSDELWVEQLPANAYVVQLAAMDTQEDMRSFQRSNAVYAKTRILRARQKDSNKRYYILVAGPFESKSQADAFMQSNPLLNKGWLRSSKSMKNQFTKS